MHAIMLPYNYIYVYRTHCHGPQAHLLSSTFILLHSDHDAQSDVCYMSGETDSPNVSPTQYIYVNHGLYLLLECREVFIQ